MRLWDLESGKETRCLDGHKGGVVRVVFSADSRRALSGATDRTFRLWDLQSGEQLRSYRVPSGRLESAALSPDARCMTVDAPGSNRSIDRLPPLAYS